MKEYFKKQLSRNGAGLYLLSVMRFIRGLPTLRCKFYFDKTDGRLPSLERMLNGDPNYCNVFEELKAFTGLDDSALVKNLLRARGKSVNVEFQLRAPKNAQELYWYYRTSEKYLFENAATLFWQILDCAEIFDNKNGHMLDYGAGVGTNVIYLAEQGVRQIDYFEISIIQKEFLKFRLGRRPNIESSVKVLEPGTDPLAGVGDVYDVIILHDVIEHIPEYERVLSHRTRRLTGNGYIFESTFFEPTVKEIDIHLSEKRPLRQVMELLGMSRVRSYVWKKNP